MNDTRTRLREVRQQARLIRAELELGQLRRAQAQHKRLLEDQEAWEWISTYNEIIDRLRGPERDLILPVSTYSDRRFGCFWPFWRTWVEHARLRASARILCTMSTLASGAIRGLTNYVIGEGYVTRAAPKAASTPKALVAAASEVLDDFERANDWRLLQRELFANSRRDGEVFLREFPQSDGILLLRQVLPEQILEPPDRDLATASFGILNHADDIENPLAYWVCLDGDAGRGEEVDAREIYHLKLNVDRYVKRGLTDFSFDTYDTLKGAQRLIENLSEGSAVQAAIALIRQHDQSISSEVSDFVGSIADYVESNPYGGPDTNVQRFYPGSIHDIPKGYNYVAPPFAANAQGFVSVVQAVLRSVAVRWNAPEWLISGDASNNNYSSSITAESPFVKGCKAEQWRYQVLFTRTAWRAMRCACDMGRLRAMGRRWSFEEVRRAIDLQVEPPTIEVRNKQEEAQVNAMYIQARVKSIQTVQQELGLDSEQELQNIEEWEEKTGGQGEGLPMPGEEKGGAAGDLQALLGPEGGEEEGGGEAVSYPESLAESLLAEACVPNKSGRGYHDSRTGRPCRPTPKELHGHAIKGHQAAVADWKKADRAADAIGKRMQKRQMLLDRAEKALKGAKAGQKAKLQVAYDALKKEQTADFEARQQAINLAVKLHQAAGAAAKKVDTAAAAAVKVEPAAKPKKPAAKAKAEAPQPTDIIREYEARLNTDQETKADVLAARTMHSAEYLRDKPLTPEEWVAHIRRAEEFFRHVEEFPAKADADDPAALRIIRAGARGNDPLIARRPELAYAAEKTGIFATAGRDAEKSHAMRAQQRRQKSPSGAQPAGPRPEHAAGLAGAIHRLAGPDNLVDLADLKKETGLSVPELHAAVRDLQQKGLISLTNYEGRQGFTPVQREVGIPGEGNHRLGLVLVRPGQEQALLNLAGQRDGS